MWKEIQRLRDLEKICMFGKAKECGWDWREVSQPRGVGREQVLKGLCAVLKGP